MAVEGERVAGELTELEPEDCLRLVATLEVGRIAVTTDADAPPLVVPVNYVVDGKTVVFRSDKGSKLVALRQFPASFQVDFVDPFHRTGWSVLIQGVVEEVDAEALAHLALEPWTVGAKPHWLRVVPAAVSGRRLHLPLFAGATDARGYL